jgi:hypothetical protein
MDQTMKKSWSVIAALAFVLLTNSPIFAQPPTATFYLNSAGSGLNLGGVYTSPYTGQINGGSTIPVICDDFHDDSYVPELWTAYVTPLTNVLGESSTDSYLRWMSGWSGSGSMANPLPLNQQQAYGAAAILAIDILNSSGLSQEEYSFAMWELFDPTQASAALPSQYQPTVAGMLSTAVGIATGGSLNSSLNGYNVTIYSYDAAANPLGPVGCGGHCPPPPQEFITVSMAEPSFPAVLGLDLLAVAGLVLVVRRRLASAVN